MDTTKPRLPIAWTTDSGTLELPRIVKGQPLTDLATTELLLPLKPSITQYQSANYKLRNGEFVADVRRGWRRSLAIIGGVGVAFFLLLMIHGLYFGAELAAAVAR